MLIKFLNVGTGDPKKAASYVLGERDHQGNTRAGVEILRGDPEIFNALAQSVRFQYCYTSAVIAWAPEDQVTDAQIQEVLDVFEAHAFAGLEHDQYHMTAVQHLEEDGSRHLHILIPRLELKSGKSLNIAPPGHRHYFDPLRDYLNFKYAWARPDDPLRMKDLILPSHLQLYDAAAVKTGLQASQKKARIELIHQFVESRILHEVIYDRQSLLATLREIGEITRVGNDYISLKTLDGTDRLRGAFYHEQFTFKDYCENRRRAELDAKSQKFDARQSAEYSEQLQQYAQRLETVRNKRQQYNRTYYTDARVSRDDIQVKSSPAPGIERAADDNDPRKPAAGSRMDGPTSHEPTAVRRHQNSDETTTAVSRERSKRHEPTHAVDQQKRAQHERIFQATSTTISDTTTGWIAKISRYREPLSKNSEIHFNLNHHQHLQSDHSIHLNQVNRGAKHETDTTSTNEKQISARFTTTNTAVSTDTTRTAEYSAIAAQLSTKITTKDRDIRNRIEQQKRDAEKLSSRTVERTRDSRFEPFFDKIGAHIQSSIQRIFRVFSNSSTDKTRDTESHDSLFELAPKFAIDRLAKHTKRVFSTRINAAHIARLRDYEKQARRNFEEFLVTINQRRMTLFLLKIQRNNAEFALNEIKRDVAKAEKILNDSITKNFEQSEINDRRVVQLQKAIEKYTAHMNDCFLDFSRQLYKSNDVNLQHLHELIQIVQDQQQQFRECAHTMTAAHQMQIDRQFSKIITDFQFNLDIRQQELAQAAQYPDRMVRSVFAPKPKVENDLNHDYDLF
nr:hypothetical protein [Acinetobacter tandoii]